MGLFATESTRTHREDQRNGIGACGVDAARNSGSLWLSLQAEVAERVGTSGHDELEVEQLVLELASHAQKLERMACQCREPV